MWCGFILKYDLRRPYSLLIITYLLVGKIGKEWKLSVFHPVRFKERTSWRSCFVYKRSVPLFLETEWLLCNSRDVAVSHSRTLIMIRKACRCSALLFDILFSPSLCMRKVIMFSWGPGWNPCRTFPRRCQRHNDVKLYFHHNNRVISWNNAISAVSMLCCRDESIYIFWVVHDYKQMSFIGTVLKTRAARYFILGERVFRGL